MMTLAEALDLVISRTGHEVFREQTADGYPEAEGYRRLVMEMAQRYSIDAVLADAKAEGIPERIEPARPCGGCPG